MQTPRVLIVSLALVVAGFVAALASVATEPASATGSAGSAVSAGWLHTCALTTGAGAKCWGHNDYGQLGIGTTIDSSTPVSVTGLTSGVAAVSGGWSRACALTTGGGVKCWGGNFYGQLGNGPSAPSSSSTPVDVTGLTSGVAAVSAGSNHVCALTTGGGVKCWGENGWGQLGIGTTTGPEMCGANACSTIPANVCAQATCAQPLNGVAIVSAGWTHTCALTTGGGVKCWGDNSYGQLGNGTTTNSSTPVDVTGLASGVAAVSAGGQHACALTTGGGVKCWGRNDAGQLGDGTTTNNSTPVDVTELTTGVAAVSAGTFHTCALTTSGGLKCWGPNGWGQLGNGTTMGSSTAVNVTGLTGPKPTPTPLPPKDPDLDTDGDTMANSADTDDDNDACPDVDEVQTSAGSELSGGLRNPHDGNDYFNPTGDGLNRIDDVLLIVQAYFDDDDDGNPGLPPYEPGYDPGTDRTYVGPLAWNLGPPNGLQRVDDILNSVKHYFHDCS